MLICFRWRLDRVRASLPRTVRLQIVAPQIGEASGTDTISAQASRRRTGPEISARAEEWRECINAGDRELPSHDKSVYFGPVAVGVYFE